MAKGLMFSTLGPAHGTPRGCGQWVWLVEDSLIGRTTLVMAGELGASPTDMTTWNSCSRHMSESVSLYGNDSVMVPSLWWGREEYLQGGNIQLGPTSGGSVTLLVTVTW